MNALQRDLKKLVPLVESLGKETVAADPHRQRFHLQPPVGWLNDPNGLCVYGGQYHAFFQYGPFDVNGGVKHWGHAVSTDLLHWEQLPVMLYPDEPFDCHGAYSGSALVEDGTMYLYYTGNVKHPGNFDYIKEGRGHNVCLAVSRDGAEQAVDVCFDLTCRPGGRLLAGLRWRTDAGLCRCGPHLLPDLYRRRYVRGPHQPVRQAGCALPPPARGGRRAYMGL